MDLSSIDLENYIAKHSSTELEILNNIYRNTYIRHLNARMVCGHIQGLFLNLLSRMIKPVNILEIGTFTGYSSISLAQGLAQNGVVHTIEINEEIAIIADSNFKESHLPIKLHIGDARKIIPSLNINFDLIYIDGEKKEYPEYLQVCLPVLNSGGFLIADNVLWSNKVLNKYPKDKATQSLQKFNDMIASNPSLLKVMLPLRDGLTICQKIN